MTQPLGSGAPIPVVGVTGGPGLPQGTASIEGDTGNVVISPPSNTIQVKKTNVPQVFQIYEYYASVTDFSRISLNTQTSGPFQLAVETQPPGVLRSLWIISKGTIVLSGGNLLFGTDNTWDFGQGGAFRARYVYAATGLVSASLFLNTQGGQVASYGGVGVPNAGIGINGDFFYRSDGAALTTIYQKRAGVWVGIV